VSADRGTPTFNTLLREKAAAAPQHADASARSKGLREHVRMRRRRLQLGAILLLAVMLLGGWLWYATHSPPLHSGVWVSVRQGVLPEVLLESGSVVAKNETHVVSRFTGEIVWKIAEGSFVEPGTVIVRFNASTAKDELEKMLKDLFDKEETVKRAQAELDMTHERYVSEIALKRAARDKTLVDRSVTLSSPSADEKKGAELTLLSARLQYQQAEQDHEANLELHRLGFVTRTVLKQKALRLATEKANLAKADVLHQLALAGMSSDSKRLAELAVADAQKNLSSTEFDRDAQLAIKQADLELVQIELDNFKMNLELKKRQIEDADVKAPVTGRVAFVDVWKGSSELSPIQVGELRNQGLSLCKIVDTTVLRVKVWVNESDSARLQTGQPAEVRLPAFPERVYKAQVSEIALIATDKNEALSNLALRRSGQAFVNVVAVLLDFVNLNESDRQAMRLHFTADAVIDCTPATARGVSRVLMPWGCLQYAAAGQPQVRVRSGSGAGTWVAVELGISDARYVEVLKGLSGDEQIFDFTAHESAEAVVPGEAHP